MKKLGMFIIRQLMRIRPISLIVARNSIFSNNEEFTYRLFTKNDSIDELTRLINIAYKANADKGMNFLGSYQDSKTTLKRIKNSVCIVVFHNNAMVATISFKPTHKCRGSNWFNKPYVAKRNQLAVLPEYQQKGIASHLIKLTEIIAKNHGAEEIAVDTAENNTTLFNYYKKNNYRFIENVKWKNTNYNSVIYSKNLII